MSYGRSEVPCKSYRPWKGQEPLCGNCAWTEEEHKGLAEKWEKLQAENAALREQIASAVKAERERIRDALITDRATGAVDYSEAEEYADKIIGK